MKKQPYLIKRDFWHKGILVYAGGTLKLTALEAKYIGHLVEEVVPDAPVAAPEPVVADPVIAPPVADEAVVEAAADEGDEADDAVSETRTSRRRKG
jgi:hypothetical protein